MWRKTVTWRHNCSCLAISTSCVVYVVTVGHRLDNVEVGEWNELGTLTDGLFGWARSDGYTCKLLPTIGSTIGACPTLETESEKKGARVWAIPVLKKKNNLLYLLQSTYC